MEQGIVLFFVLIVLYTLFALWLGRYSITMPMVFVILGALTGPDGLGWTDFSLGTTGVETLTEITLALLLFADAATLSFRQVRDDASLPARLLFIGLPLVILVGAGVAHLFFPAEDLAFALLAATILAPTDAALGLSIFNNQRIPVRIRRTLNVESGLNDGIASPLVVLFIALLVEEETGGQASWLLHAVSQIGIGVLVGGLAGLVGGWLFALSVKREWTSNTTRQIGNPALAMTVFLGANVLGGNGFVAAFIAGILFGYATRHILHDATEYTELTGTILSMFVWFIFGSILVPPLFRQFNTLALVYALFSLTLVRILPVFVALGGLRLRVDTRLMMGWFGPRGLASVVFLIMAFEAAREAQAPINNLVAMCSWTIFLSVILHGISALPLANRYARRIAGLPASAPELLEVSELATARRKPFTAHIHS